MMQILEQVFIQKSVTIGTYARLQKNRAILPVKNMSMCKQNIYICDNWTVLHVLITTSEGSV